MYNEIFFKCTALKSAEVEVLKGENRINKEQVNSSAFLMCVCMRVCLYFGFV